MDEQGFELQMDEVLCSLQSALERANSLKTGERNEKQRKLAILATEIEKVVSWATFCSSRTF